MIKSSFRLARNLLFKLVPYNRTGDKLIAYYSFYRAHNRLPRRQVTLNDVLFSIKTTNEILDPIRVFTTDKEFVKLFIKSVVGDEYNVPTVAVLHSKKEVQGFNYPERCVIKPTHASGRVIFRLAGEDIDFAKIDRWFGENYYKLSREANYKHLKPKLIIEPLLFDEDAVDDIKFFCFRGAVKLIQWDFDRHFNHTRKYYTSNWTELNYSFGYPISHKAKQKPMNLEEMICVAEELAKAFEFVRIDMYTSGEKFYIGEITHVHGNACERFLSVDAEKCVSGIIFG